MNTCSGICWNAVWMAIQTHSALVRENCKSIEAWQLFKGGRELCHRTATPRAVTSPQLLTLLPELQEHSATNAFQRLLHINVHYGRASTRLWTCQRVTVRAVSLQKALNSPRKLKPAQNARDAGRMRKRACDGIPTCHHKAMNLTAEAKNLILNTVKSSSSCFLNFFFLKMFLLYRYDKLQRDTWTFFPDNVLV